MKAASTRSPIGPRSDWRASVLPKRYTGERSFGTAIYFLLTPETFSAMHRLVSDEVYHFYLGDPVELLCLREDGSGEVLTMGTDLDARHEAADHGSARNLAGLKAAAGRKICAAGHNGRARL